MFNISGDINMLFASGVNQLDSSEDKKAMASPSS